MRQAIPYTFIKRLICSLFVLAGALSTSLALGHGNNVSQVPAGRVAYHFLARLSVDGSTGASDLVGYIVFIEGVRGPFFDDTGPPGEATAFFTVRIRSDTFPAPIFLSPGSDVAALLFPPGSVFDVFFDETPDQAWDDLNTFSNGKRVATFKESALLSTSIINANAGYGLFSSDLITSTPFRFHGQRVDFKKLVPNGVTINNFATQTLLFDSSVPPGFSFSKVFGASAVAIGGGSRHGKARGHDDDD